ncbi:TPA: hypothetical protein ACS26F_001133 [Serratia marcescens]|nr:hypothetical protein [Serratia marcescens]HAU4297441.1 hypothetical protein [Serratia marcescens]
MENINKEKGNKKAKTTMIVSLGEKRMDKFKSKADELELNYSSVIQQLIDDWLEKQSKKKF